MGTRSSFRGSKAAGRVKQTIHLHLVPWSVMSGVIHPLPQYAFMAWCSVKRTGITLPLTYYDTWYLAHNSRVVRFHLLLFRYVLQHMKSVYYLDMSQGVQYVTYVQYPGAGHKPVDFIRRLSSDFVIKLGLIMT
jgi:hypothetical protein